jgi:intracellular sulfur oxidation DsrE/DsrF family protein
MKKIVSIFLIFFSFSYSETEFAEPIPSIDNVRKIVFPMVSGADEDINHVLDAINNVLKFYRPENVQIRVIAYYHGIRALKKSEKIIRKRVEALMTYDVEFVACGNTMRTKGIKESEMLDDIEYATAGIVEINESILKGYNYIRP